MGRYTQTPIFKSNVEYKTAPNKRYYGTTKYPEVPLDFSDIYVITTVGDRIDVMANEFYGDSSLYWIIASANPQFKQNSLTPPAGTQLRIPTAIGPIISAFELLNEEN